MKGLNHIFIAFFISLVYYLQYIHICYIYCREIWGNRSPVLSINIAKAVDGLSLLFIILSTFDSVMYLSGASINIERNYFSFVIDNRISISKCICSNRNTLKLLYMV
jgi:NADH:ubiquinone oxidoreductase subunit 4 (subunit M)